MMLPLRSLNEIDIALKKAAMGAGLTVGLAEDVGEAGAWLAARGYDGVGAVLAAIRGGVNTPAAPVRKRGELVFTRARIAVCGPSAIDILAGKDGDDEIRLLDVDSPLLLLGMAGVAAKNYGLALTIGFETGKKALVSAGGLTLKGRVPGVGADLVISCKRVCGEKTTDQIKPERLIVGEGDWCEVEGLAARTYVPSTDVSRARGAGAGMLDND